MRTLVLAVIVGVGLGAAVAATVAVVTVLVAREAGVDDAPATAAPNESLAANQGSSLKLTLTAAAICETERGIGGDYVTQTVDDAGNVTSRKREYLGHFNVAETPVRWRVTGGTGPYTLVIDNETRDAKNEYVGAVGAASASCAITTAEPFIFTRGDVDLPKRAYRADPEVDSGLKTIRATVTDGSGNTAEATVDVYVILQTGSPDILLRSGQTYRVLGHLITIPEGTDFRIGEAATGDGGSAAVSLDVEGSDPLARIWLDATTFRELRRIVPSRDDQIRGASADSVGLSEKFDELMQSLGRSPISAGRP